MASNLQAAGHSSAAHDGTEVEMLWFVHIQDLHIPDIQHDAKVAMLVAGLSELCTVTWSYNSLLQQGLGPKAVQKARTVVHAKLQLEVPSMCAPVLGQAAEQSYDHQPSGRA